MIPDIVAAAVIEAAVSSEIKELIGMHNRILVMRKGPIVDDFSRGESDRELILKASPGKDSHPSNMED